MVVESVEAVPVFLKTIILYYFGFGSKLLVANMINIIAANLPTFMIGRLFNATNLGLFNRGQSLAYFIPLNFSNVLTQACYPVFCEVQNDGQRLRFFS